MVVYSKTDPRSRDIILVVVNLDPFAAQAATLSLDLGALGLDGARPFQAYDELIDTTFTWHGHQPWVRLDPGSQPAHLLHLRQH
jgi:starch synthase (maltosyl-transferring)